jgi:hypothetical protein
VNISLNIPLNIANGNSMGYYTYNLLNISFFHLQCLNPKRTFHEIHESQIHHLANLANSDDVVASMGYMSRGKTMDVYGIF